MRELVGGRMAYFKMSNARVNIRLIDKAVVGKSGKGGELGVVNLRREGDIWDTLGEAFACRARCDASRGVGG